MSIFQGFSERYLKEIQENIDYLVDAVAAGNVNTFEEYKKMVGRIAAHKEDRDRYKELLTHMENASDD